MSVITFTSDFGVKDGYAASVKGVILTHHRDVKIVDVSHDIDPQNILQASLILEDVWLYFPKGTVHLAVVDPGVGTPRRRLILRCDDHLFVGPDNGVFSFILKALSVECWELNAHQLEGTPSKTFEGRDVFASCAAKLALGHSPNDLGMRIYDPIVLENILPQATSQEVRGEVIHIDRFGNLITNIKRSISESYERISFKQEVIPSISQTYASAQMDEVLALWNSADRLEISVRNGSAKARLNAKLGDAVILRRTEA